MRTLRPALLGLVLSLALGCRYIPLPGGELDGTPAPVPADWSRLADTSIVQVETRPDDPYSVNLWAVARGDAVYLHSGDNRAAWIEHLEADPRLRLQIEDAIYELRAERVTSQEEFDRFAELWDAKYGNRPRNEDVDEAYLMRLGPR